MFSYRSKSTPFTAHINGRATTVAAGETLLQAALRHGIDFPHSCRVGGCATCKCTLVEGKVRELTDASYVLADDPDRRAVLACQSVPLSDIRIEVDLSRQAARRMVAGRIVGQDKLTHDITLLRIRLDEAVGYRAGQYADISIAALPDVRRSYSFATPAGEDGEVSFFVRRVPGGVFSTLIDEQDVTGQEVVVDGPAGDFWLRPSDAPLLLVAGGSGLAPVLALLQEAAAAGVSRSTTLLFGAREEKDLYALDQIDEIRRRWRGAFRFVPVLSDIPAGTAPGADAWAGRTGLVTGQIAALLEDGAHAYLCGPPAMIDSAVAELRQRGVAPEHLHADRFVTRQDTALPVTTAKAGIDPGRHATAGTAGVLDYLKYFLFHLLGLCSALAIIAGGHYITAELLTVLTFYIVGDAVLGDDTSTPVFRRPGILTAQLWLALPLLILIVFAALWSVSPGDPLGFGGWITRITTYDALAARDATAFADHVSTFTLTGLMIGMVGTITAHELTHRTWDPVSMFIGRWLLAFSFDTVFSIEHVYGHHRYVSTEHDPATAPRGRNVYHHIVASTIKGNISAWEIEARRLARNGHGLFSPHNAVIRGHLMSALLVGAAWAVGGPAGAGFFALCALWGKALLEIVNYMEHYGIVRDPHTPVQPRHSWNTNKRISSWSMFNLTRHSHHHAQGEVPYQDLKPVPDAPMMINGYLTTIMVALVPPLWHALMTPKVLAWDRAYASAEELELAARANARSGIAGFRQAS